MNTDALNGSESGRTARRILVLGLGGAGCNTIARIAPRAPGGMDFAVMDCDFQTLDSTGAGEAPLSGSEQGERQTCAHIETRLAAGKATDGLSAGGDIETGRRCAEAASAQIEALLSGLDLLMVITGLSGGFGSGASPVVARIARTSGVKTLFFTVLPFPFEGPDAQAKAQAAIRRLRTYSDTIVQMPNALIQPDGDALLEESLERSSRTLAAGVVGLWRLLMFPGICNLDYASLHTLLSCCDAFCRFACATATGEDRAAALISGLRTHPLVGDGDVLANAPGMIIGITGGEDLKLSEVQQVIDAVSPKADSCWIKIGIAIDPAFNGRLSAIVLAAEGWKEPLVDDGRGGGLKSLSEAGRPGELGLRKARSGTFGGAEQTIWNGENLDVPTYLRRKIKLPR